MNRVVRLLLCCGGWMLLMTIAACGRTNLWSGAPDGGITLGDADGGTFVDNGKSEICGNSIDDDGNGLTDCHDPKCWNDPACTGKHEICDNGVDDDGNNLIDCDDPACASLEDCQRTHESCINSIDDDGDGLTDCADPDCFTDTHCIKPGKEICNNGIDDNSNNLIDCADPECMYLDICKPRPTEEICGNGIDDDGNGAADCADPACATFPACLSKLCKPTVDFGTLDPKGSSVTKSLTTSGTQDIYISPCAQPGGGEVITKFTLSGKTDLKLEYDQTAGGDHVFGLFRAGSAQPCNANPLSCYDPQSAKTGSFSIKALEPGLYYLFVEAFAKGLEGTVKVTLSTGTPSIKEICNNGIDDNNNGALDCADLDCFLDPYCTTQNCTWDVNLGSLVVNGPGKSVTVDTTTAANNYDENCGSGKAGERIIRFVMPTAAGLTVSVSQTGWHVFGLHHDLGPGTKCNAELGDCFDSNAAPSFTLVYDGVEKGVYYYIVDGIKTGSEGIVDLTFAAVSNRGPELCANGIDDDGNGLVDCMDTACFTFPGCPGPPCQPDMQAGSLTPNGSSVTMNVDTTKGSTGAVLACALGGGKEQVIELTLTQVSGLGIHCTQSGDHVFGLFAPVQPRDACDAHAVNCADPSIGGLGCDFIMPNLQPGKYYLIVQAFQAGAEGTMTLNLSATPDHAVEICNNNIDDDDNGLTDCQDAACVDKPICQGTACAPDVKLGLLPTSGTPASAAILTVGAGDNFSTSCASGGGQDGVVSFSLAVQASVQVDYAQFGNHVFGLFNNKGQYFACDVSPQSCQPSNGQSAGKLTFSGLAAGNYYLIVDAVSPGNEGSVAMKVSAK